jgi:hypothetical protein
VCLTAGCGLVTGDQRCFAIVGAGFFGLYSALYLAKLGFKVEVFERNKEPMMESSTLNQARIHGGYHYPRALQTAGRCRANYSRFVKEFNSAISDPFISTYVIAQDSKVSAAKFERFAELIEAPLFEMPKDLWDEFDHRLVEKGWIVEELAFNSRELRDLLQSKLHDYGVVVHFEQKVMSVNSQKSSRATKETVTLTMQDGHTREFYGTIIATYGQFLDNQEVCDTNANILFEICELVSISMPKNRQNIAITIMDGPYWSITPWPAYESAALTHVRFTPHVKFSESREAEDFLKSGNFVSRGQLMVLDASRYLPFLLEAQILESKYVIKTVLRKRDYDDARPVIYSANERVLSIIGSKIDNIYEFEPILDGFLEELSHGK